MAANERIAVASDPGQEIAHALPHVVSKEYQQEMEGELRIELTDAGYTVRQSAEVVHAFRAYAALTREWNRQRRRVLSAEANGEGFRAKAYDLLLASRRMGAKVRDPKILDRTAIERMRAAAAHKHEKVTKKIVGNWFVMAAAVLLKAFLLVPLADKYLLSVLPDAEAVRSVASIALAAVLAYTLTFVARYLVQVGVGMHAPEDAPHRRSVADMMTRKANVAMFRIVGFLFVVVIGTFLVFDFVNAGENRMGTVGLSVLFLAILLVFEMFLAYRLTVMQDEQPESMEAVDERYIAALNRADDETDLAKLRTLALDAEKSWNRFLTALDSGVLARKPRHRRRALAALRQTMGTVESAHDALLDDAPPVAASRNGAVGNEEIRDETVRAPSRTALSSDVVASDAVVSDAPAGDDRTLDDRTLDMDALERASLNGRAVVAAPTEGAGR